MKGNLKSRPCLEPKLENSNTERIDLQIPKIPTSSTESLNVTKKIKYI